MSTCPPGPSHTTQSALELGHEYAARAERFELDGEVGKALEMARKGSESYGRAGEETTVSDPSVKSTMQKLQEEWTRRSKDLQRRAEHTSNQASRAPSLSRGASRSRPRSDSRDRLSSTPERESDVRSKARANGIDRLESAMKESGDVNAGGGQKTELPHTTPLTPPGESFMMLADNDPSDPFNQFWTIMQGVLENLSAPVAWATVPLNGELSAPVPSPPRVASLSPSATPSKANRSKAPAVPDLSDEESETFSSDEEEDFYLVMPTASPPLTASPGNGKHSYPPMRPKTREELHYENIALKQHVDSLSKTLQSTQEALAEKEAALKEKERKEKANLGMLRDSLADMRRGRESVILEGVRHGLGGLTSSRRGEQMLRPSEGGAVSPQPPAGVLDRPDPAAAAKEPEEKRVREAEKEKEERAREAEREKREEAHRQASEREKKHLEELESVRAKLKAAEEESMKLRIENEKNKADYKKYKDRWNTLKEHAKQKQQAKEAAAAAAGAGTKSTELGVGATSGRRPSV